VIRQAISCDICASEKKQTNHWFVAFEQSGELRLSGWSSRNRLRPGMKHLCGQICLHKLVDEFMARMIEVRVQTGAGEDAVAAVQAAAQDVATETREAAKAEPLKRETALREQKHMEPEAFELSANLPPHPDVVAPRRLPLRGPTDLVAVPARQPSGDGAAEEASRYTSRNWRAEAWDRERERELRAIERRPELAGRRRSGS
jgi:hypothetical protein